MTKYVTLEEEYKHKFFQVPKVFFTNDKYKSLSNNAKIAWSLLRDRTSLSRKNKWYDLIDGRRVVYFIFTNEELMKLLNVKSKSTLSSIKKELENADLIESHRRGINKPNKMYLIYPEITEEDIYAIDEFEEYEYKEEDPKKISNKKQEPKKEPQSQERHGRTLSGRPENGRQDVHKLYTSNTDSSNTDFKELDNIDTDIDTEKKENNTNAMSKEHLREQYIKRAFYENTSKVPGELAEVFSIFCETTEESSKYYKAINKARLDIFDEALKKGYALPIMNLENEPELLKEITNVFVRSLKRIEEGKKGHAESILNPTGYLYKSVQKVIWEFYDMDNRDPILDYDYYNEHK